MRRSARPRCGWPVSAAPVFVAWMAAWTVACVHAQEAEEPTVLALATPAPDQPGPVAAQPRLSLSLTPPIGRPVGSGFDVGLRWRQQVGGEHMVDITAWRRVEGAQDAMSLIRQRDPVFGARVEMQLKPIRRSGFTVDQRFIGLQLDNGARISLRRKNGAPTLYFRQQF